MKTNALLVDTIKTVKGLGWIIVLSMLALNALAAEPPTEVNFRQSQQMIFLIGLEIRDSQDQKLGRVEELALDLENGRLVEVIVSSGGFLGFGQRNVAVPPGVLRFDPADGVLRINVNRTKFDAAPDFAMSEWAEHTQSQRVAEVYRYYGREPYFAADGQGSRSGNTATEPLSHVQRFSKLVNLPVKNLQNEHLGSVNTILFDLLGGRIRHVIVLTPGSLQTKRVIPATALWFNVERAAFTLDVSAEAFKNEPRFKWIDRADGEFQQETYSNTEVAANDGLNTRQNVREGTANTYIPLVQGTSFADVDITYRIYKAIMADASLSQNARNVEVGTLNGRVTLRGYVNSEEEKRVVGGIAAMAWLPENVSNLLEVRPVPVTNRQAN